MQARCLLDYFRPSQAVCLLQQQLVDNRKPFVRKAQKTMESVRFSKVSTESLKMTPTLRREDQICFFWREFVFVRKGSWRLCFQALMCDQEPPGLPSPLALFCHRAAHPYRHRRGKGFRGAGIKSGGRKKSAFQGLMCGNQMRGLAEIRSPGNHSDMLREYH